MNRHHIALFFALLLGGLAMQAQSKFDGAARALLSEPSTASRAQGDAAPRHAFLVKSSAPAGQLACFDRVEASPLTPTITLVRATADEIATLAADSRIKYVGLSRRLRPMLNLARTQTRVNEAHEAADLDLPYDGTGVITSLFDIGLDPNHRTFLNDDGTHRIARFWHFDSYDASFTAYDADELADFTTDAPWQTHATHVLGIMAGSYNGPGRYCRLKKDMLNTKIEIVEDSLPYRGVAYGSEIVAACGELYDVNIIEGVAQLIDYAHQAGKPIVVNLSLGENTGPHDGTDLLTAALNDMGDDAIIFTAAGNEGDEKITTHHTFTDARPTATTFLSGSTPSGQVDIWASDSQPMDVEWVVLDTQADSVVAAYPAPDYEGTTLWIAGDGASSSAFPRDSVFAQYFRGEISISRSVNPLNNRINAYCTVAVTEAPTVASRRYRLGLRVAGPTGQRVDFYTESDSRVRFSNISDSRWLAGTTDGSISNMACGKRTIAVGSFTSRTSWGSLDGRVSNGAGSVGSISYFSSWGVMPDSTSLPHVCAPGQMLISAASLYWMQDHGINYNASASAPGLIHDTDYYTTMGGTSMATPMTAGIVALWLQADPTLTRDDVLEIINRTSTRHSSPASQQPRWGAGKINALRGLQFIRNGGLMGIPSTGSDLDADLTVSAPPGALRVVVLGASRLSAELYDMAGRLVGSSGMVRSDELQLPTPGLARGIYALRVTTDTGTASRRVAIP